MAPRSAVVCVFACGLLAAVAAGEDGPVVAVTGGEIRGRLAADGGAAFRGIPYARPPLGDLRWREPQPVAPWTGVREAAAFSISCTQLSEGWNLHYVQGSGEDCLYLNVATPEWPPKTRHPVLVWIHGGSNTAGGGEAAGFDQRTLVRRGIVLVTINYRLGALGFLVHPELSRESRHHASGNYGLMDQLAALAWVRDNIERFGGDRRNVTAAGQSAGAYDISLLLASPRAKGLFQRAITQSAAPAGFDRTMSAGYAEANGRRLAAQLKAPDGAAIPFLRTVASEEILKAEREATHTDRTGLETSVDGYVLPKAPVEVYAAGHSLGVPLLTGSTAQEVGEPNSAEGLREAIRKTYGDQAERALALYGLAGGGQGRTDPLYGGPGTQWGTDTGFRCPCTVAALDHSARRHPTYQYEFEQPPPGRPATAHSSELNFLFGTWGKDVRLGPMDEKISLQMQAYWVNFARTGDPNGEGLPPWPRFTAETQEYLAFTSAGAEAKAGMRRAFCEIFLKNLREKTKTIKITLD